MVFALVSFLSLAQLLSMVPRAFDTMHDGDDSRRGGPKIGADDGVHPYVPARSSDSSNAPAISAWAAPSDSVEVLPMPIERAPRAIVIGDVRAGFARGVERPPRLAV
jgi:hypothetical protein